MEKQTSLRIPRGRPLEFDMDTAVEHAMEVFWPCRYHNTSLCDLFEATNLSRGSLYATFGDKRGLFLRALDCYINDALARLDTELNPVKNSLAGLRNCLPVHVDHTSGIAGKRGCLVVATAMELAAHDTDVEKRIQRFLRCVETLLTEALARAQAAGELADDVEPAVSGRLLLSVLERMRVVGQTAPDHIMSQAMFETFIDRFVK